MRTVACEGRAVVLSANQCVRRRDLPGWITGVGEGGMDGKVGRRAEVVTETVDDHEITWPTSNDIASDEPALAADKTAANGISSSFHLSTIPADDEAVQTPDTVPAEAPNNHILALPSSQDTSRPEPSSPPTHNPNADDDFVSRGGSCIISPTGAILAGPLWDTVEDGQLLTATVDFEDCERGRLDLDVAGSYSRNDSFELRVAGLDISPPP